MKRLRRLSSICAQAKRSLQTLTRLAAALPMIAGMAGLVGLTAPLQAQVCLTGSTGPDIVVWELPNLTNYSSSGGFESIAIATTSCNVGDTNANWFGDDNRHPVIAQNLYRLRDVGGVSRFEHVGRSWVKHGFFSTNVNGCCGTCAPTPGTFLGPGCSDPYSSNRNGFQNLMGPRFPINAHTGQFSYPFSAPGHTNNLKRLEVSIADLFPTNSTPTRYFGEGHYVAADDAAAGNGNNNASYREITAFRIGTEWLFGTTGPTVVGDPAIRAWKTADPEVQETEIQLAGEGFLILASKVTPIDGGWWDYEYALYNMNSDDSIRSFSLPVPGSVAVRNVGFHDLAYRAGDGKNDINVDSTDWADTRASGALTWQTATFADDDNANALRWGSLMNFRFEANAPPAPGTLTLGRYKSGLSEAVDNVDVPSAPPGLAFCAGDGTGAACPAGSGCGAGATGRGCLNSSGRGALLRMTGFPATGDLTAWGSGLPTRTVAVLLRSTQLAGGGNGVPFGDGLMCVGTQKDRIAAGVTLAGQLGLSAQHAAGPGTFHYQLLYRNQKSFCTPAQFNLSNGYSVTLP